LKISTKIKLLLAFVTAISSLLFLSANGLAWIKGGEGGP